jgi:hypothetical protein
MLESGFPSALNYGYVVLLAANALSCVVMIWLGALSSAFFEVLVDTMYVLACLHSLCRWLACVPQCVSHSLCVP